MTGSKQYLLGSSEQYMLVCRGVAVFEGGVPMRMNSVRMLWGSGVRAGLYPLSALEAYWFTTYNSGPVCAF